MHAAEASGAKEPGGQSPQACRPAEALVPGAQGAQAMARPGPDVPAGHVSQAAPSCVVPGGHGLHSLATTTNLLSKYVKILLTRTIGKYYF